jgi:DNA-binding MarR family transcriptional regulator
MESIANHLEIKPPSATTLIRTLERKGYVIRKGDPDDRRVVNIELTSSAKRKLSSIKKKKDQAFESLLTKLSASDRKELTRLLILLTEE